MQTLRDVYGYDFRKSGSVYQVLRHSYSRGFTKSIT